jgi:IMP cyclohydrolase
MTHTGYFRRTFKPSSLHASYSHLFSLNPHILYARCSRSTRKIANVDAKIAQIEQTLGYEFRNKLLCAEALQMAGPATVLVVNRTFQNFAKNVNLAILGDTVLTTVLCKMWYETADEQGM